MVLGQTEVFADPLRPLLMQFEHGVKHRASILPSLFVGIVNPFEVEAGGPRLLMDLPSVLSQNDV